MNSIYLVLDMQNDLVHQNGPNGKSPLGAEVRSRDIVGRTARAINLARAAGPTQHVKDWTHLLLRRVDAGRGASHGTRRFGGAIERVAVAYRMQIDCRLH